MACSNLILIALIVFQCGNTEAYPEMTHIYKTYEAEIQECLSHYNVDVESVVSYYCVDNKEKGSKLSPLHYIPLYTSPD
jgi:hypothetical protein